MRGITLRYSVLKVTYHLAHAHIVLLSFSTRLSCITPEQPGGFQ